MERSALETVHTSGVTASEERKMASKNLRFCYDMEVRPTMAVPVGSCGLQRHGHKKQVQHMTPGVKNLRLNTCKER